LTNFRQPRRLSVSDWADEHRVLDPLFSSEPGPWRTSRVPHAREWMDSGTTRWVRRCTVMAGTQIGKSEAGNNLIGYFVHQDPRPVMLVVPRKVDARMALERRIKPMVRASPALQAEATERHADIRQGEIVFRRSVVYLRSAQSPADLASVPVGCVIGDETEKWPRWSGTEASPLELVIERTRTFYDHLIVLASTPHLPSGLIAREFADGDQRRYHVPCPHCGAWILFEWANVKWDHERYGTAKAMRAARAAWYACQWCGERITDSHKLAMVQRGVWVPAGRDVAAWIGGEGAEDRTEHRSYSIWAAYSPWVTWWRIAAQYLRSKDEPSRAMNFTNSWLAETWEERVEAMSDDAIAACVDARRKSFEVPDAVVVLSAAVDVQKDYMAWQIVGWGTDEESWVIACGRARSWQEVADVLLRNTYGPKQLPVTKVLVDSRFRRDEVIDFCRVHHPTTRMIAGVERAGPVPFSTVKLDRHPGTGAVLPVSMTVWTVNVGLFKDTVASRLWRAIGQPNTRAGRIHLPADLPAEVLAQFVSEHKVVERSGNVERARWVLRPGHKRNEAWDLLVYNAAAARMLRVDTLRSAPPVAPAAAAQARASTRTAERRRGRRPGMPLLGE